MTPEQLLLAALTFVTGILGVVSKLLWARVEKTETAMSKLREDYDKLAADHGVAIGTLNLYRRCRAPSCPFAEPLAIPHA